jgi:hypothetical protein
VCGKELGKLGMLQCAGGNVESPRVWEGTETDCRFSSRFPSRKELPLLARSPLSIVSRSAGRTGFALFDDGGEP